jgi:molybdopterin synthase catalytic subunit
MTTDDTIRVKLLFFARARELAGCESLELRIAPGSTLTDVVSKLCDKQPAIRDYVGHCRFSINEEFAPLEATVPHDAEIALIPPVSGGR